ncbi:aldolase [Paraburkholderia sp. JHI869]|uniref:aldolase n=1 Tax=Paraburkholderia sp. JHI869 TaxID=3112959 RepID=UPI00317A9BEE
MPLVEGAFFVRAPGTIHFRNAVNVHSILHPFPYLHAASADMSELYRSEPVAALRKDLAFALRAAAHFGLEEGVCNHFSVALPDERGLFLLNPQGLMWREVQADDIVIVGEDGSRVAGRHDVEPTAMFIHAAIHRIAAKRCVLHTHMPNATALTLIDDCNLDTTLSQNAMRFHGRVATDHNYKGLALDVTEGERLAHALNGRDIAFLSNHGVIVCGERIDYAFDDLYYLERACESQVLALSTGKRLRPVSADLASTVAAQMERERQQSELFFAALKRVL